jgi:hypothetical protein
MEPDYLKHKQQRQMFAELPQPGKVAKTKVRTDNAYMAE